MTKQFHYSELLSLTNETFANHIQERLNSQMQIREVMAYRVRIDRHGYAVNEIIDFPEDDAPIVVVDYLVGWKGVPSAQWTYWFNTYTKLFDHGVVNKEMVDRFNSLVAGAEELPELGIYTFPNVSQDTDS